MRAFTKLRSIVSGNDAKSSMPEGPKAVVDAISKTLNGESDEFSGESSGDVAGETPHIDALLDAPARLTPILSQKRKAPPKKAPAEKTNDKTSPDIVGSMFETTAAAEPVLKTIIPAKGPAIIPAKISAKIPAKIKAEPVKPEIKKPQSPAPKPKMTATPPEQSLQKQETQSPMPTPVKTAPKAPAPKTETKPSGKLAAELANLDSMKSIAPAKPAAASTRELGPRRKTASLSHMRNDLAQLNKDMSSGEQFYAQSLRRINSLIEYAYETESTLSALEQLEPENARLKTELLEATKNLTDQVVRAESMKSKADAYETRYLETRQALEKSQLSLTQMEALRETLAREIESKDNDVAIMMNKAREIKNAHNLDAKSLDAYKAKASELANELSVTMSGRLELEKRLQDLSTRFESLQTERDTLERMVTQTRNAQRATEEHNLALKTQLETVLSDVKIFKQQFDAVSQNKDAEVGLLRSKLADMNADLAVKDGVVHHAHEEMAELREKFDTAHRGRRKLLEHIEGQKSETEHLKAELEKARAEHSALTSDYVAAQNDITNLGRVNDAQSEKLKRYAALDRKPVVTPSAFAIKSNIFAPSPAAAETAPSPQVETPVQTVIEQEPPVFAISDTPPPLPETFENPAPETFENSVEPIKVPDFDPQSGIIAPQEVTMESITPVVYPDINHDFEPETDRRAPDSPMRMPESRSFEAELAELTAMAPIPHASADVSEDASDALKSEAQRIEDSLLEFHDLDLLADSAG